MNTKSATIYSFRRMLANILSILVSLAVAFPLTGSVYALEPNSRILASITYNWFQAEHFAPEASLSLEIYNAVGGTLLWGETRTADNSGFVFVGEWEHPLDLIPGYYITVSDGSTTKDLVLEAVTITVFDPSTDFLAGTAPKSSEGRQVWVGTGNESYGCSMDVIADPVSGDWIADFSTQSCNVTDDMWGAAQVFDEDGDASEANPPPPSPTPRFVVFPEWEFFDGLDWPDGANVSISVLGKPECYLEKESWGGFFNGNFPDGCDVEIGDTVAFDDGTTNRRHVVRNLYVTDVDVDENTVSGKADAGATIYVWAHDGDFEPLVITTASGEWQVDLDDVGYTIKDDSEGRSEIRDEVGNATASDWHVIHPRFTVFPEWEFFDGLDWPNEATVTITVADKPECETTKESWGYFFNGNFGEGCDIEYGDEVTFTDGITTRTHNVRTLYVTDVNVDTNTVSGKAEVEAGTIIYVWAHDGDFEPLQLITSGSDEWSVDLSEVYTIRDDSEGRSEIRDAMGNATASDWHVTHPHFTVFPEWEWFDGLDWPNEATVTVTVAGKDDCTTVRESWGYFFNGNFGDGCDVELGDQVTFDDGTTTLTHTVQELAVTSVDVDADTVAGTADPDTVDTVYVWPHCCGEYEVQSITEDGAWLAEFPPEFDLEPGMDGRAEIRDGSGNATAVDWHAPKPWLIAFPENEAVEGWEWPDGTTITLTIDNAPEGFVREGTALVTDWGDPRTYVRFDFGGEDGYDLKIGDKVTLTGEDGTFRSHIVQNLSVTDVNATTDTISGTADSNVAVTLWPHGYDQIATVQTITGEDDTWLADFTEVGFNLVPGIGGRSTVSGELGNWTAVDWNVPMDGWKQINDGGFGDLSNNGVTALEIFHGQLYASASNWEEGGQVWRLGIDGQWEPVSETGFGGGVNNPVTLDLAIFQGQLYAGTGLNYETPGQVWRSTNGTNWQLATDDGFGDSDNITVANFVTYKGMLYAGTGTANGSAQIWRSLTGNNGSWTQVAPDDSGSAGNVTGFAVYKGILYAAIEPRDGFGASIQVWRSTNGSDWVTVTADGFGIERNESTGGFSQFGGYLYLGIRNEDTGAQLWRTNNGIHWEQVVSDGFGDLNNIKIESLLVYDDFLYAVTYNLPMGLQIWRSADGVNWEWVAANGFGDSGNFSTLWNSATAVHQGQIVVGTWNYTEGGEVWMFTP